MWSHNAAPAPNLATSPGPRRPPRPAPLHRSTPPPWLACASSGRRAARHAPAPSGAMLPPAPRPSLHPACARYLCAALIAAYGSPSAAILLRRHRPRPLPLRCFNRSMWSHNARWLAISAILLRRRGPARTRGRRQSVGDARRIAESPPSTRSAHAPRPAPCFLLPRRGPARTRGRRQSVGDARRIAASQAAVQIPRLCPSPATSALLLSLHVFTQRQMARRRRHHRRLSFA
jgi:hypothetical protein